MRELCRSDEYRRRRRRGAICHQRQFELQNSRTKRKNFEVFGCSPDTHLTGAMFVVALLPQGTSKCRCPREHCFGFEENH